MFAEYCSTPFDIEAVKVINADGSDFISPDMGLVPFEVTDPALPSTVHPILLVDEAVQWYET